MATIMISAPRPSGLIFSWPSRHKLLAYVGDKDSADLAQPHLTRLIRDLNDDTSLHGKRLVIIGHSMGYRALVSAIKNEYFYDGYYVRDAAGRRIHRKLPPVCDYLVLIEPDIDLAIFQRDVHLISPLCRRIVAYQSSRDKAIAASAFVHTYPRVGNAVGTKARLQNVDFVNMSTAKTDFLGHSYDHPKFIDELAKRVAQPPAVSQGQVSTRLEKRDAAVPALVQTNAKDAARAAQPDATGANSVVPPRKRPFTELKPPGDTLSLPEANPHSNRPQCGGRERKFLAVVEAGTNEVRISRRPGVASERSLI